MSWQTPFTTWSNGDRFTYEDMNRITGNINVLYPAANLREDYTQNDILTVSAYESLTDALNTVAQGAGITDTAPGYDGTADTFNQLESMILAVYDRLALNLKQKVANIYTGDGLYSAASGSYPNCENHTRGI